jgi:hypothetical protein
MVTSYLGQGEGVEKMVDLGGDMSNVPEFETIKS